jgi:hypothetical protein
LNEYFEHAARLGLIPQLNPISIFAANQIPAKRSA